MNDSTPYWRPRFCPGDRSSSPVSEEVLADVYGHGGQLETMIKELHERQELDKAEPAQRDGMIQLLGNDSKMPCFYSP